MKQVHQVLLTLVQIGHVRVHKIGDDASIQTDAAMPDRPKM